MSEPLLLSRRLAPETARADGDAGETTAPLLVLALSADERQRLRGHCRSACGRDLLLQLPREGGPLQPQERLAGDDGVPWVRVEAAPEELLVARSDDPFTLLRAAYHLGNRHVALELRTGELRLLQDPVLAELLRGLGVSLQAITAPFAPESGAYTSGHSHHHGPTHGEAHSPDHEASPGGPARHASHPAGTRKGDLGEHHHPHRH
jgi:urease accessory protein